MGFPGLGTAKRLAKKAQKAVRETTKAVTKGTPFEGVGKSLTQMNYKDPAGSFAGVAAASVPMLLTAALNPGGLAQLGAQAGAVAINFANKAPDAVDKAVKDGLVSELSKIAETSTPAAKAEPPKPIEVIVAQPKNAGGQGSGAVKPVASGGGIIAAILRAFGLA